MKPASILVLNPLQAPDAELVLAAIRAGHIGILDLGNDRAGALAALERLKSQPSALLGVRVPEGVAVAPGDLPANVGIVVLQPAADLAPWKSRSLRTYVQVTSLEEALAAEAAGADGVIAKGYESGGRIGSETSFVLLQHLRDRLRIPVWLQGGIGLHTAVAAFIGGAEGIVLDCQLALVRESGLPAEIKAAIAAMDGSETTIIDGHRVYTRPDLPIAELAREGVAGRLGATDLKTNLLPMGADAAFAKSLADRFETLGGVLRAIKTNVKRQVQGARVQGVFSGRESKLARRLNLRYPIAQGPMTRVSDTTAFAKAVADGGGLPFLALAVMRGQEVRRLLDAAKTELDGQTWGVGILGFVPPELQEEQLEVIHDVKPPVALIAGGRPAQAKRLEDAGITTFIHVPSPGLLELFLSQGARRFVFEGLECGGHVGPRSSFVLWESQIERLLKHNRPEELSVLFAGGIHDRHSAAMVSAIASGLIERGVEVGVLMGTAYIFTEEAVSAGAIKPAFQEAALACESTVLLDTAPGHSTRCAETPYVQAFRAERARLEKEGRSGEEVWAALEELNLGRLRIASKGLRREGDSIVEVDEETQRREGMVMLGDVAALNQGVTTVEGLHREVAEASRDVLASVRVEPGPQRRFGGDVAIVGMSAIMPGADNVHEFWSNIVHGVNSIREVPAERWNADVFFDPDSQDGERTPSKWGGFIDPVLFDPLKYGIPPRSLAAIEPVQLLALEVSRRALEDANYVERDFDRERTSVLFGAEAGNDLAGAYGFRAMWQQYAGELPESLNAVLPKMTEDSFPGILANVISGRIANRLDLGGANYTVDAACASSLAAVDLACKELLSGSSDMVICGGADLHNSIVDYLAFASVHALSPTGQSRTFDAAADGIALGEGIAAVVLKRLEDAERDGDRIYAVIKGVGTSSDGRSLGLTAPRPEGEERALERAYEAAGVSPAEVGLIEAHGTGTVVGDRTELETLTGVFRRAGAARGSAAIGSVKSQIGHTKCAAGVTGLIKSALALHHRVLPPTLNVETPNAAWSRESPFNIEAVARPWLGADRKAGVSAFGFGGTNFHVVLAEYEQSAPEAGMARWPAELFLFRGETSQAALKRIDALMDVLSQPQHRALRDLARSASTGAGEVQVAVVATGIDDLKTKLQAARQLQEEAGVFVRGQMDLGADPKLALLFPGQGSQRPGMLREVFLAFPQLRRYLEDAGSLADLILPTTPWSEDERAKQIELLTDTRAAQPALGVAGLAVADLLLSLGIKPDAMGGHSYGELVALAVAGVIDPEDLVELSRARAESILDATAAMGDPGAMAAVSGDSATVSKLIAGNQDVVVANENSPEQTVISGTTEGVFRAIEALKAAGVGAMRIQVACAFHSPLVAPAQTTFRSVLDKTGIGAPKLTVYSNTTAEVYPGGAKAVRARLAEHIARPVRFASEIEAMYEAGVRIFVESGPGRVLTNLVSKTLGSRPHLALACDDARGSSLQQLLTTLGQLAVNGIELDVEPLFRGRYAELFDLEAPAVTAPSPSAWWVNGQHAWPVQGELPPYALKPITAPVVTSLPGAGALALPAPTLPAGDRETVVLEYLRNVRETFEATRNVMLSYLGQPQPMPALPPAGNGTAPASGAGGRVAEPRAAEAPVPAAPAPVGATASSNGHSAAPAPAEDLEAQLMRIVSDRTGYPIEMLGPDLDLEADLSIDSIKRIEILGLLTQRLGIRDADALQELPEDLVRIKTMRGIVSALNEWVASTGITPSVTVAPEPVAVAVAAPSVSDATTPASAAPVQSENLEQLLIALVSERTGYPADMLGLDLDLEADLSIDSIKRIEILGAVTQRLGIRPDQAAAEMPEDIVRIKTMRGIARALEEWAGTGATPEPELPVAAPAATNGHSAPATQPEHPVMRFVASLAPTGSLGDALAALAGSHVAIMPDDSEVTASLSEKLQAAGAVLESDVAAAADAFVDLRALGDGWQRGDTVAVFEAARDALVAGTKRILIATRLGGLIGAQTQRDVGLPGAGLPGMVKSFAKEWPDRVVQVVNFDPAAQTPFIVEQLCRELEANEGQIEIDYSGVVRRVMRPARVEISRSGAASDLLAEGSVIMALGGARGITALSLLELARRSRFRFELLGRTPLVPRETYAHLDDATDLAALRRRLAASGEFTDPASIERECRAILANRDIWATIDRLQALGSDAEYHALDVRDDEALGRVIDDVYKRQGRIDGVIHGAGILDDKLAVDKTGEAFGRVFETKAAPAVSLANRLREGVKFVALFGSVVGVFGNRGQSDYAAANDFLDRVALARNGSGGTRYVSLDWGPWAGSGMVDGPLAAEYARRGIHLIAPEQGVQSFVDELLYGAPTDAQVILTAADPAVLSGEGEAL